MTVFLICMIPLAGMFGFMLCAMLTVAATADQQEEKPMNEQQSSYNGKEDA